MCLLITQSRDTDFTEEHLLDFYGRNRDGIGVMWAENGALHYEKTIPKDAADSVAFYNRVARGKDCAVHYRMRTHGDIDMDNCHPYEVFGFSEDAEMPMLLMHNGVLHTGNSADTSKSDTYHYIKDYLRVLLASDPSLAFTPEFGEIIGKHIGSNRFAIMNHLGQLAVINKHQGVTFRGAWLSNEYAWSAHKYLPKPTYYYPSNTSKWGKWNPATGKFEDDTVKNFPAPTKGAKVAKVKNNTKATGLITNSGGKKRTGLTTSERNSVNGLSVDSKWLDDVLDIRNSLDSYYLANTTTNKQIECMIEEMGVTKAYLAVELLMDGYLTEKSWDTLSSSRTEQRWFKSQPLSYWYPDSKVETH